MANSICTLAREAGFESIKEVAQMVNKPYTTLYDWGLKNPKLLRAVIIGCAEIKKEVRSDD